MPSRPVVQRDPSSDTGNRRWIIAVAGDARSLSPRTPHHRHVPAPKPSLADTD